MRTVIIFAFALAISANGAQAGWSDADACAAQLPEDPKMIYDNLKPLIIVGDRDGNEEKIKTKVKAMVSDGELSLLTARGKAKQAVSCLEKVND